MNLRRQSVFMKPLLLNQVTRPSSWNKYIAVKTVFIYQNTETGGANNEKTHFREYP